jgi:CDP-paratose 2-epimerase
MINRIFEHYGSSIAAVIHAAAQPSHDWAAREPLTDFSVNATGTLNLLEATRRHARDAAFIFCSTNKVYGDAPNRLLYQSLPTRYEPTSVLFRDGLTELMSIDQSMHSVFGASKVAADIMAQEYGRYFDMNTGVFRGGCLTGQHHAGAKLHGFLSYLVRCIVHDEPYTIFGYNGKQVRDNIHASDMVAAFVAFMITPRPGEVYNIGGGRANSCSVIEAIKMVEKEHGRQANHITYSGIARRGDHKWWITDLGKIRRHYPNWDITIGLQDIIREMVYHETSIEHIAAAS